MRARVPVRCTCTRTTRHLPLPRHQAENADEKIRIKTLSLGVVIPDITFELAKRNDDMYLFSPYDVGGSTAKTVR